MKKLISLLALTAFAPVSLTLRADEPAPTVGAAAKLDVGSPAPELKVADWIQGEPVTKFDAGKTYLIECWATWCGPCVASIPHIDGLHKKYADKGLVVVGVNVSDGPREKVAGFVKKQGGKMSYRVAFDGEKDGLVSKNWLNAAGAEGIPHAFAVRGGKIIWQGHPAELSDAVVESMISDRFDAAAFAARRKAAEERNAKGQALYGEAMGLVAKKNYDEALKKADAFAALLEDDEKTQAGLLRADILSIKGDIDGALASLAAVAKAAPENVGAQYTVAAKILGESPYRAKTAAALPYAKKAAALADHPALKLLVARAEYAAGDKTAALADLEKLSGTAGLDDELKAVVAKAAAAVKDAKPWPDDGDE